MTEPKKTRTKARKELMAPITLDIDPEVIKRAHEVAPNPQTAPITDVIRYWARQGSDEGGIGAILDMGFDEFFLKLYAVDEDGTRPWLAAFQKGRSELNNDMKLQRLYMLHTTLSEKTKLSIIQDIIDETDSSKRYGNSTEEPTNSPNDDAVDVVFKTIEPSSDERKAQVLELIADRERKAQ